MKSKQYAIFFNTEELKRDMKQRAIRGGVITSASQVILFILGITSTVVLARLLIPEHFGLIGMVAALTILVERFQDIGLGDAIVQRKEITHEQVSTLFWINLGISILLSIIVALSAKAVALFYDDQRLIWITVAFALNFVCSGSSIQHQALIRRQMRFDHFALIKILSAAFGLGVGITLAMMGYGYWALVWKELGRSFLSASLAWSFCHWRPGFPVRNADIISMLKFGGNVTGYNILYYLTNNLDSILLGKFFGAGSVGLYSRAKQLTAVPINQLLEPIRYISLPALSTFQNDSANYEKYIKKMLAVLTFIHMPLIVYIGIYSQPIVYIALGEKWMDVVPLFRLLSISVFFLPINTILGLIMLSLGNTNRYLVWGFVTNLMTIISFFIGIRWGVIGIATSWPIVTCLNLIFSLFFVFKSSPITITMVVKSIYKSTLAAFGMGILLLPYFNLSMQYHVAFQLISSVLIGGIVYVLIWMLFPGGCNDVKEILSYPLEIVKKKFK